MQVLSPFSVNEGINRAGQQTLECDDFLGNRGQPFEVGFRLFPALFVGDDFPSFAQGGGEVGFG